MTGIQSNAAGLRLLSPLVSAIVTLAALAAVLGIALRVNPDSLEWGFSGSLRLGAVVLGLASLSASLAIVLFGCMWKLPWKWDVRTHAVVGLFTPLICVGLANVQYSVPQGESIPWQASSVAAGLISATAYCIVAFRKRQR